MLEDLDYTRGNIEAILHSGRVSGDVKAMAFSYTCDKRAIRSFLPEIFKSQSNREIQLKIATLMAIYELTYFNDLPSCCAILNKLRKHDLNEVGGFEADLFKSAYNFVNLLVDDFDIFKTQIAEPISDNNVRSYSIIGDSHIIGLSIGAPKTVKMFYLPGIRYKHISGRMPNAKLTGLENALLFSQNSSTLVFNIGEIDFRMAQINSQKNYGELGDELEVIISCFKDFCLFLKNKLLPHQSVCIIIPTFAGTHLFDYEAAQANHILLSFVSQFTDVAVKSGFGIIDAYSCVGPSIGIPETRYLDWAHFKAKYYHLALRDILNVNR